MEKSFDRWIGCLRSLASEYEHKLPPADRLCPSIDDICNEMIAFRDGFNSAKRGGKSDGK